MARPLPLRRLASGALAGALAGLVLHGILAASKALEPIAATTPFASGDQVAAVQLLSSVALGVAFVALPVTGGWVRGLAWGLGYGAAVWLVLDMVLVRAWAGNAMALDRDAWLNLLGRLAWGAALGLSFVGVMVGLFRVRERRRAAAA
jgi:uncharacterized membrane protein YagU involved in acid resistance